MPSIVFSVEKPIFFKTFAGTRVSGISEKVLAQVEGKRRPSKSFLNLSKALF
jgi:hypothetical protein